MLEGGTCPRQSLRCGWTRRDRGALGDHVRGRGIPVVRQPDQAGDRRSSWQSLCLPNVLATIVASLSYLAALLIDGAVVVYLAGTSNALERVEAEPEGQGDVLWHHCRNGMMLLAGLVGEGLG